MHLGVIGNSSIGALVDGAGDIVWACLPRFDGDAVFCSLLRGHRDPADFGFMGVELSWRDRTEQHYLPNTPILVPRLYDDRGGAVEIVDFAPRFRQFGLRRQHLDNITLGVVRTIAIALLSLAGCIDEFQGSNVQIDLATPMPVLAPPGATPREGELPNNIHYAVCVLGVRDRDRYGR